MMLEGAPFSCAFTGAAVNKTRSDMDVSHPVRAITGTPPQHRIRMGPGRLDLGSIGKVRMVFGRRKPMSASRRRDSARLPSVDSVDRIGGEDEPNVIMNGMRLTPVFVIAR